jgi:hypothetical protein
MIGNCRSDTFIRINHHKADEFKGKTYGIFNIFRTNQFVYKNKA